MRDISDSIEVFKGEISSDQLSKVIPECICIQANIDSIVGRLATAEDLQKSCERVIKKQADQFGGIDKITFHPIQTLEYGSTVAKPCYVFEYLDIEGNATGVYNIQFTIS